MLKWISSKLKQEKDNPDHPLGTDGAIRAFLDELVSGKPETALISLTDWLGEPEELSHALSPGNTIRALTQLDEFGQAKLEACWSQFVAEAKVDHLAEQKLKTLDAYYQAAYKAYQHCLGLLASTPAAAGDTLGNLPGQTGLFTQRAVLAQVGRLRVMHIRYRAPDPTWWQATGEVLAIAQSQSVFNLKQKTYASDLHSSSPWLEYLIALFFEICPLGNLVPQQMDLVYRLLRWIEPHVMVQSTFSTQSPYYVYLDRPGLPKRAAEALPADSKLVYFGPGLAYGQLVRLRSAIKTSATMPDWMKASRCPIDKALAVIDALIMHWSERPPERLHARERKSAPLHVCNGFSQIRRMIAFSEFARSGRKFGYKTHLAMLKFERFGFADTTQASASEEEKWKNATPLETVRLLETSGGLQMTDDWTMQDISAKGIGAVVPFLKPWIVIGAYIGFRIDAEIDWRLGILRRIHRTPSGHPAVGIEMLAEVPRCAQIQTLKSDAGLDPWSQAVRERADDALQDAIVISTTDNLMLIPPGLFEPKRPLDLLLAGVRAPVRLKSLMYHTADCDCVQYELIEGSAITTE